MTNFKQDKISETFTEIINEFIDSNGMMSKKDVEFVTSLKRLCEKLLSINESMQLLNQWSEWKKES